MPAVKRNVYWLIRRILQFCLGALFLTGVTGSILSTETEMFSWVAGIFGGLLILSVLAERHTLQWEAKQAVVDAERVKARRNLVAVFVLWVFMAAVAILIFAAEPVQDRSYWKLVGGLVLTFFLLRLDWEKWR
jgi:predicted Na+-dependent transporter